MPKKYQRAKNTRNRKNNNYSLVWIWLLIGIFVGVCAAALVYTAIKEEWSIEKVKQMGKQKIANKQAAQDPTKPTPRFSKEQNSKETQQHYEFYTLLPGMEVPIEATKKPVNENKQPIKAETIVTVPKQSVTPSENHKEKPESPSIAKIDTIKATEYILQIGMFRQTAKADALKANLLLQGLSPHVHKIKIKEDIWFRVTLGPYANEQQALKQKKQLEAQKMTVILMPHQKL